MATTARVVILFGSGPNVGAHVAQKFASAGYKVAIVSRSGKHPKPSTVSLSITADLLDPNTVPEVFEEVRTKLGEPSLVIYNAVAFSPQPDLLSVELKTFQEHLAINTTSAFIAVQEAVKSFDAIADKELPRAFIFSGNKLNEMIFPPLFTLGLGKSASSHLIEYAAQIYGPKGYGFYYADERTAQGDAAGTNVDGEAHADFYYELAGKVEPATYLQTFVKGQGYVKF